MLTGSLLGLLAFDFKYTDPPWEVKLPSNLPKPVYSLNDNPITEKGFLLGKKLFYDGNLSSNGIVSCGFCHQQPSAFTQHGHDVSHGVNDRLGKRNSLAISNVIWQKTFFWDGGVNHLDFVPLNALENPVEMDETLENVLRKLNQSEKYRIAFREAFQVEEIQSAQFLSALSQFMATLISANSRYDKYVRNEGGQLSGQELSGLAIFKQKCSTCHATDLFTDGSYRNNGISNDFRYDKGREEITLNVNDRGKFKVPSLRNIEYTDPYMHNGSFYTLEEVLDHYTDGVKDSETLDPVLKQNAKLGITLNEQEKKDIVAFLKTLTDHEFLRDKRFSEY
ncbi:MAG: c-type cytochrome [Cytophagales bacterium]|nr:c-type cytochrome [Cytophagales bacterium]